MLNKSLLFSSVFVFLSVNAMENTPRSCIVYSHGFGEAAFNMEKMPSSFIDTKINASEDFAVLGGNMSVPQYPDAPETMAQFLYMGGNIGKAVFYTKPAVITLANHLHEKANSYNSIKLIGRSCGAGTALNCLAKLVDYENNKEYFEGSAIKTKEDAERIINAVNNGAFIASAPFLSLRKAKAVAFPSALLSGGTCAVATGVACCVAPIIPAVIVGGASYLAVGDYIKKGYAAVITKYGVPIVTHGHFDPSHPTPLESIAKLRGKLTCPILLHFNKNDGVLENPDTDTIKVYDAFKGEKTHILISDDASHNRYSKQLREELLRFKMKYVDGINVDMQNSQPAVKELKKQIYASRTFFPSQVQA